MPALIYPLMLLATLRAGGLWPWALVLFNLVIVPAADHLLRAIAPHWQISSRSAARLFSPTAFLLYAGAQTVALCAALAAAAHPLTLPELIALASGVGIMTGTAGLTAAHELIHRPQRWARCLGLGLLAMASDLHFAIEHPAGHHRDVGTREDAGTARPGEAFPSFLLRALCTGVAHAWHLEAQRLERRHSPVWSIHNRMLRYAAVQVGLWLSLGLGFGAPGLAAFLLQSFIAVHLLEGVNYVQHYGLRRTRGADRQLAPIDARLAWESDFRVSELLLFYLPRHAAHHVAPSLPCHRLTLSPASPRLPYSFFLMVFLALFPPLWRAVMHPHLHLTSPSAPPHLYFGGSPP